MFPTAPSCSFLNSLQIITMTSLHLTCDQIILKTRGRKICLLELFITSLFLKLSTALHCPLPSFWLDLLPQEEHFTPRTPELSLELLFSKARRHFLSPPVLLARRKTLNVAKMIKWPNHFVWASCPYHYLPPQSLLSTDFISQEQDGWTQRWDLRLPTSNPSSDNYILHSLQQLFKSSCRGFLTCKMVAIMLFSQQRSE